MWESFRDKHGHTLILDLNVDLDIDNTRLQDWERNENHENRCSWHRHARGLSDILRNRSCDRAVTGGHRCRW